MVEGLFGGPRNIIRLELIAEDLFILLCFRSSDHLLEFYLSDCLLFLSLVEEFKRNGDCNVVLALALLGYKLFLVVKLILESALKPRDLRFFVLQFLSRLLSLSQALLCHHEELHLLL